MINQEGINSLNTGAEPITYEGTEGPKSPELDQAMAMGIPEGLTVEEAIETFKASEGRDPNNIEEVIEFFKNMTLSKGPIFPSDEDPVNPFGPKPMEDLRQMAAFGGIMGLDQRRQYGLGSKFKRAISKITRPFTKVAQKLMPKELAGIARMGAPFLAASGIPYAALYGGALSAAGQAKQSGKVGLLETLMAASPGLRFQGGAGPSQFKITGVGGETGAGRNTLRDLFLRGDLAQPEFITPTDQIQRDKPIFGEYGTKADKFLFGGQEKQFLDDGSAVTSEAMKERGLGDVLPMDQYKTVDTSGIIGKGGEALFSKKGGPGILDTQVGQLAFGTPDKDIAGKFLPSKLKLGSWAIGIISGIQAGKYKDAQDAADAAESQLMATNQAASDAEVQAARDWAIETFGSMSVYADGGRIGFASGTPDPGMMQGLGALGGLPDPSENTIDAQQVFPKDMEIKLMMSNSDRNNLPPLKIDDNRFLFNNRIFNSEEELNEYMLQLMPFKADGGRINKNMGGEFNMPPAGLSSLQTQQSDVTPQGMELDLRGGGFIPIGKAEKADDVPARVSKNEFVFTAAAVKAAGGGSVNEGAKRMYDTMKRLESQVG